MSVVDETFAQLKREGRKALMPFVTAGDPSLAFTQKVLEKLASSGASLCEVGIPYSDPIADGPVIQASYTRVLEGKLKLAHILKAMSELTPDLQAPIASMVSYAIVYRYGLQRYVHDQ